MKSDEDPTHNTADESKQPRERDGDDETHPRRDEDRVSESKVAEPSDENSDDEQNAHGRSPAEVQSAHARFADVDDLEEESAQNYPPEDVVPRKSALKRSTSASSVTTPGAPDPAPTETRFEEQSPVRANEDDSRRGGSPSRGNEDDFRRVGTALSKADSFFSKGSSNDAAAKDAQINHARFEKKKRRIAARLRTQQELMQFRSENGATLGGQWVDQKWVTRADLEQQNEKDAFHAKQWFKEVGLYVLFVFAFTWVIYAGRSNDAYIGYKQFWTRTVDKHISNVSTPDTVLEQIESLFLEDFVDRDNFTIDSYSTKAARGYMHGSVLIGQVRVRQLRVKEGECSRTYAKLVDFGIAASAKCFPSWNDGEEETAYSKENGTVLPQWDQYPFYSYTTSAGASETPHMGKFGYYHGGGFMANFTAPTARATMAALQNQHWVDVKTRAVILDFVFFNVDLDLFMTYRAVFECVGSGVVHTSSDVKVISPIRYPVLGLIDVIRVGMLGFVYMMVVYYVFEDLDHCRRFGLNKYRSFGWAYVDVINISLFVLSGLFKITNLILFELAMPVDISDGSMIKRVQQLGNSLYVEDQINGLNGFLLWIKIFRYISITRRLLRQSAVLAASLPDICTYAVLFTVLLYAFAVLGYLLFGNTLSGYLTISDACLSLLRAMYGDIDWDELMDFAGDTGFGYIITWLIISNVVLLNMVIAILSEDYRRVQEEEAENPTLSVYDKLKAEFMEVYTEVTKLKQRRAAQNPEHSVSTAQVVLMWLRGRFARLTGRASAARVAQDPADRDNSDSSDDDLGSEGSAAEDSTRRARGAYDAEDAARPVGGAWKPFPGRVPPRSEET